MGICIYTLIGLYTYYKLSNSIDEAEGEHSHNMKILVAAGMSIIWPVSWVTISYCVIKMFGGDK